MNGPDFAASGAEWRVFHPSLGFHGLKGAIPVWEHWKHLRTTNVIESPFATVRHRTVRSKGCLSNKTALAMIFKLAEAAEKTWRRLNGHNQLPKIILGIKFTDGIEIVRSQAQTAAA
jgi:putative transposase